MRIKLLQHNRTLADQPHLMNVLKPRSELRRRTATLSKQLVEANTFTRKSGILPLHGFYANRNVCDNIQAQSVHYKKGTHFWPANLNSLESFSLWWRALNQTIIMLTSRVEVHPALQLPCHVLMFIVNKTFADGLQSMESTNLWRKNFLPQKFPAILN